MSFESTNGVTQDKEHKSECRCPHCGADENYYQIWESSCGGYEDYRHHCKACGKTWWVDGIDS